MGGERPVVLGIIPIPVIVLVVFLVVVENDGIVVFDGGTWTRTRRADIGEELASGRRIVVVGDFESNLGNRRSRRGVLSRSAARSQLDCRRMGGWIGRGWYD